MRSIKNARITRTFLGYEDHGTLTLMITLDYGDASQGFGGYAFDGYDEKLKRRVHDASSMRFIAEVLRVVGVDSYEELVGKHVRADADLVKVYRIGNLLKDDWFDPATLWAGQAAAA